MEVAREIQAIFQRSYRIEANLLGVIDFPPLNRKLLDFANSSTEFFGFFKMGKVAAVIEINPIGLTTEIHSLVVDPAHFRQGLASRLMRFVMNTFDSDRFVVETGLKNRPAINLYKQLGFIELRQWDTDFGIRKIEFEKYKNG